MKINLNRYIELSEVNKNNRILTVIGMLINTN